MQNSRVAVLSKLGRQWRSPRCAFVSRIAEWAEPVATEDHAASSRYHRAGSSQRGRAGGGRPHRFALGRYRDLEALADVPGGTFTFGSSTHPNSAPPHCVEVAGFKIGLYPVTNRAYAGFIEETGRLWQSQDRSNAERQSAPATDLTWRDARAYCDWLTGKWRSHGRIGTDEIVRLPTELSGNVPRGATRWKKGRRSSIRGAISGQMTSPTPKKRFQRYLYCRSFSKRPLAIWLLRHGWPSVGMVYHLMGR